MARTLPILIACTVLTLSCYSTSLLQEPQTVRAGGARGAVGFEWNPERFAPGLPMPELGLRVGLADRIELRSKLTLIGAELGANAEVVREPWGSLYLMPHFSIYHVWEDDDDYLDESGGQARELRALSIPVIAALPLNDRTHLFIGPDPQLGARDDVLFFATGAHLGLAIDYGDHATVVVECSMLVGMVGTKRTPVMRDAYPSDHQSWLTVGDISGQCGLGTSFGSAHSQ